MELFGNAYFLVIDSKNYWQATRYALYRPDGSRPAYQEMSEIEGLADDAHFASALMAPFFTGVPQIARGLRQRHLMAKGLYPKLGNDATKTTRQATNYGLVAFFYFDWTSLFSY